MNGESGRDPTAGAAKDPAAEAPEGSSARFFGGRRVTMEAAPNRIMVTEGLAIEWKSPDVPPGEGGMEVGFVAEERQICLQIRTPPNAGWIRLAYQTPRPQTDAVLLGAHALLKVAPGDANPQARFLRVTPMTAVTRLQGKVNRQVQPVTAAPQSAPRDRWFSLSGVFACAPLEGQGVDLIVNLPENAVIVVAALSGAWFPAQAPQAAFAQPVLPIAPHHMRFLETTLDQALRQPPVFAAAGARMAEDFEGWVFSADPQLKLHEAFATEEIEPKARVRLPCGFSAEAGFRIQPPAGPLAPPDLQLRFSNGETQSWEAAASPAQAWPLQPTRPLDAAEAGAEFLGVVEKIGAFGISGWIRRIGAGSEDPKAPPVEVSLLVDGRETARVRANEERLDLNKLGYGGGPWGFTLPPIAFRDEQEHRVRIVESATGLLLANGEATLSAAARGPSQAPFGEAWAKAEPEARPEFAPPFPIRILEAKIVDFTLRLSGVARHPDYPGMQPRLEALIGERTAAAMLATTPDPQDLLGPGSHGFLFSAQAPVSEAEASAPLRVRILRSGAPLEVEAPLDAAPPLKPETPAPETPRILPPNAKTLGKVETWTADFVRGWAMRPEAPEVAAELVLLLDGVPCAYTRATRYREDIRDQRGGSGFYGFSFETPPNLAVGRQAELEVRALSGASAIKNEVSRTLASIGVLEPARLEARHAHQLVPSAPRPGRISVVMLNRNGAHLLRALFASCPEAEVSGDVEWLVVDHDSQDDSAAACAEFAARGAEVRFLPRGGNYSFSESNNYGAGLATGEILLFANNDLTFPESFVERLRDYLADPRIGLLGVKLLDHVEDPAASALRIVQHLGVYFNKALNPSDWVRPYEARSGQETDDRGGAIRAVCVTGAFCAMRRADFERLGGFDEGYFYGLEDVDLCLKVQAVLNKDVVCAHDLAVVHHRGFSRNQDEHAVVRRRKNNELLNRRWGGWLRRTIKESLFSDSSRLTGSRPVIAFLCADVGDDTWAGDYFTALEMGGALQDLIPCHVRYVPESGWYDLAGVDLLISMVPRFDLNKLKQASPWLVAVNWARQWFDRLADHPATAGYDHVFASSAVAARYLEERLGRPVGVLPIAAGKAACSGEASPDEALRCDYSFTGSRFGAPREIEFQLDPPSVRGTGKIFGHHWEGTPFEPISVGPVAYSRIPAVYASTKIVLDDANVATKSWGSCNSRVFDAMAAGRLVLTNGVLGARELFGDLAPTFDSREELTRQLNLWLRDDDEREARARQLRDIVREKHNYAVRARALVDWISSHGGATRIAIKCAAKYADRAFWGDYHFAESLAAALRRLGHVVRVDCRETWSSGIANSDDVVVVLRGLVPYKPRLHQYNLMWLISHPHDVPVTEMQGFDHVYVASQPHAEILTRDFGVPASFLPQCADVSRFRLSEERLGARPTRNLYVANSRGVFRDPARWALRHKIPIDIYGGGWEPFLPADQHRGHLAPNAVLGDLYGSSRLTICDHWEDMRQLGYVSNRIFDVLASGGRVLTDRVAGIEALAPARYLSIYDDEASFVSLLSEDAPIDRDLRREAAEWTARHHSFDARAREISERIAEARRLAATREP